MEVEPDEARAIASEVLWMTRLRLSPVPGGCEKEIPAIESIRVIGEGLVERYIPESGIKCGQIYNTQMDEESRFHKCEECWQRLQQDGLPELRGAD